MDQCDLFSSLTKVLGIASGIGALWVCFSAEGWVTPGYRTPFHELPESKKRGVWLTVIMAVGFLISLVYDADQWS